MELRDLIVTPFYLIIFSILAYVIRPYVTNQNTRKYFLPALWVRFAGAVVLGLVYQFYYNGGDTFNYWKQATIIYDALFEDIRVGSKLLFLTEGSEEELYEYTSKIYWYKTSSEYFLIRVVAFFSIFAFKSYSATSLFFALASFGGSWAMFSVLQKKFTGIDKWLVVSILYIPSCIFWGSGILKDTITLGFLGFLFWGLNQILEEKRINLLNIIVILISAWIIYKIKIYILLCFIPSVFIWWYLLNITAIKKRALRLLLIPVFLIAFISGGYFALDKIASSSNRYNLDSIAKWSYITSYDIRYYSGKDAGSGYDIGIQDGTWETLLTLAPAAVNVSLFRPYIWEVQNPLMLLSALESILITFLTLIVLLSFRKKKGWKKLGHPTIAMMIIFSLTFAFAVGVSTYNFGSLSRYKIPLLPFYITAAVVILKWNFKDFHKSPGTS